MMIDNILHKIKSVLSSKETDYSKLMDIKKEVSTYSRSKAYHDILSKMDTHFTSVDFIDLCIIEGIPRVDSTKFLSRACKRGEIERISYGKYKKS